MARAITCQRGKQKDGSKKEKENLTTPRPNSPDGQGRGGKKGSWGGPLGKEYKAWRPERMGSAQTAKKKTWGKGRDRLRRKKRCILVTKEATNSGVGVSGTQDKGAEGGKPRPHLWKRRGGPAGKEFLFPERQEGGGRVTSKVAGGPKTS